MSAPALLVLLTMMVCDITENGQPGDNCTELEVRAANCRDAMRWAMQWVPPGHTILVPRCVQERVASR